MNRTVTGPLGQAFTVDLASLSAAEQALFGALPPVVLLAHQWDRLARTVTSMADRIAELEKKIAELEEGQPSARRGGVR